MKYILLITQGEWLSNGTKEQIDQAMVPVGEWWGRQFASGKMLSGAQLQPAETATTVVIDHGRSTLLDRPLLEAKEAIGGYGILEAADMDEALAIVRTYPSPDTKIEVRPVVER